MSDHLPGIPPEDQERPASPAEIKRANKERDALEIWYETGDIAEVRRRLGVRSNREAHVWVNRGSRRYFRERNENLDTMRGHQLARIHWLRRHLRELVVSGDKHALLAATDRLVKLEERESRLLGLDAEKDVGEGPSFVIVTAPPWERPGGEVVDAPQVEEGEEP